MTVLFHVADRVLNRPLMIHPDKLSLIASVLDGRIGIDSATLGAVEADYLKKAAPGSSRFVGNYELVDPKNPSAGRKPYRTTAEGVAIIPVIGSLVNRGAWVGAYSGLTSYEGFKFAIGRAAADPAVSSIILDMDTPGGEAVGAFEAGDAVREAARAKEVVAVINGMAASAGYAIASAASRIVTTSSGVSGSVGVVMLHADYSKRLHNEGIVPTLIFAGSRKVDGNPYEKLTAEVKGELQGEIDRFYDLFVATVAKGRASVGEAAIRATEARTFIGADAVAVGLADEVGTFESVLAQLTAAAPARRLSQAAAALAFTSADLASARAEGRAEGFQLSVADGGLAAAMARIDAVMSLPEAQGRRQFAQHLASQTNISIEAIRGALMLCPTEAEVLRSDARRAGASPLGLVLEIAGQPAAKETP
ncbi:S49 family peptidase [Bradyrhizobium australafricanum]|uniref:S49 family peptidase n=1 Tax=Bradyrhizobium australafricanum TaxID=2821406 RepID=UPI001CE2A4CA|nr:S49 family peptidase [Bradyrhizobium australafricanum]MCA6099196.1 S49 family peptidase [Bradyrhizobium australafricanum]